MTLMCKILFVYYELYGKSTARGNYAYHCPLCHHTKPKLEVNFTEDKKGILGTGLDQKSIVESWRVNDIIVSELDFGQGDYSSDDLNEISVTLSYDIANLYYKTLEGKEEDTIATDFGDQHNKIQDEKQKAKKARITKNWTTIY